MSPYAPSVGALPGGMTPGFQAPMPPNEWTFNFTGFMNISAQFGLSDRPNPAPARATCSRAAAVVEDYQSFVSTTTAPGNWVQMNFRYGNRDVTANLTLSTWNPSAPTTYYQLGSQNSVNNAFLTYNIPPIGKLRLRATLGYFFNNYGNLGPYTAGIYQMPYVGGARGIGELLTGEYPLTPRLRCSPRTVSWATATAARRPAIPPRIRTTTRPAARASYVHHLHVGLTRKTENMLSSQLHWMFNFAQDDRLQFDVDGTPMNDNMVTRSIDESHIPDAPSGVRLRRLLVPPGYGLLAIGGSRIDAHDA